MALTRKSKRLLKAGSVPVTTKSKVVKIKAPKGKSISKTAPTRTTRKRAAQKPNGSPTKKRKTGMKGTVNTSKALGVVDPESNLEGSIYEDIIDDEPLDVMLVLIDPSTNTDKYFVLQLIELEEATDDGEYVVYTRYGRTGTAGSGLAQYFEELDDAIECFQNKFTEKTALEWATKTSPSIAGKYKYIIQNFAAKAYAYRNVIWQYWVDDGVDGKDDGWYNYDENGAQMSEQLYSESTLNNNFNARMISSGNWVYAVDFQKMTQTNVVHPSHTIRHIRRVPPGQVPDAIPYWVKPQPNDMHKMQSQPSKLQNGNPETNVPTVGTPSRGVDADVSVIGLKASDYEVVMDENSDFYDAVLNQCDITGRNNNNKYYKISLYKTKASPEEYSVWCRWGRVGEIQNKTSSSWSGEFDSVDDALPTFEKKFRDKTGNSWNTDDFVPKKGKYQMVEIDDTVVVPDDVHIVPVADDVEYMPCSVNVKTQLLVEQLFSSEMRSAALSEFDLDLKKLPLGVPSQQQIQRGIDVLDRIKGKLGKSKKGKTTYTLQDLSSLFYTTIPHSFGRARPPIIDNAAKLQHRYDMCDILTDMYTTQQSINKIQAVPLTKKIVPHPTDRHYLSLNATLTPVSSQAKEYNMIEKYFEATKGAHSRAKLLDIWAVDRQGEAKKFDMFKTLQNRRLLWHGTNLAVVAPILTNGLRIMPHSGGRVGKGIYLASLNSKSQSYTSAYGAKFACMFLAEAALGSSYPITKDDSTLTKAPVGHDSVHAVGKVTPNQWVPISLDGNEVSIPQSSPQLSKVDSSFHEDEFLVYSEAQVRIRFMITLKLR
eukprot:CFRG1491T1